MEVTEQMRNGLIYFKIVAIVYILSGIIGLVFPDQYLSLFSVGGSVGSRLWGRAFGAVSMGFGIMYWTMTPSDDQRAKKIGTVVAALAFGLTGLTDVVSVLAGDLPVFGWAFVAFNAVLVWLALRLLLTPTAS
jgi:putative effector of murein hydrolase